MARPRKKLTEEQVGEIETLAAVLNQEQISNYFGIDQDTFISMKKLNPEIDRLYKKGKAKAIGSIAQSLISKARGGDTASMIFYLKTQAGWRESADLNITSKNTVDNVEVIKALKRKHKEK